MKTNNSFRFPLTALLVLVCGISGCAGMLPGFGPKGEAVKGENSQLQKTYTVGYDEAIKASLNSLEASGPWQRSDAVKTTIEATRQDGKHVMIEIIRIEDALTRVTVRAESLGTWDELASLRFQGRISKELNRESGSFPVVLKPSGKKIHLKSLAGSEKQTAIGNEPGSGQKKTQVAPDDGNGKMESNKPGERDETVSDNQPLAIFFPKNSNVLLIKEMEKLNKISEIVSGRPETAVTVKGYPDSLDNPKYDMLLAQGRADVVKLYLMSKGINPDKIIIAPWQERTSPVGEAGPLRRVDIELKMVHSEE